MSTADVAVLGAVAGFTIFLGLPIGRVRAPMPRAKALLNAIAVGILVFLLWDILAHAWEPIDGALAQHHYSPAIVSSTWARRSGGAARASVPARWRSRRRRSAAGRRPSIWP